MSMRTAVGIGFSLFSIVALAILVDATVALVFLMTIGQRFIYEPGISWTLWNTYGVDPVYLARLQKILLGIGFLVSFGVAMFLMLVRKTSKLHGEARFATRAELEREGLMGTGGIVFGKMGSKYLTLPGERHLLVIAPTRSGKSAGIAVPNLLNWSDSVVVLDMKVELFARTSGFRAAHGHDVFLFSPFDENFCTHRWNAFDGVRRGVGGRQSVFTIQDLMGIATVVYPAKEGDSTSQFFASQAQSLLVGISLYVLESGMSLNFGQILRVRNASAEGGFPGFVTQALKTDGLSEQCRGAFQQFIGATGDTLSSILATFDAPLQVFRNPLAEAATRSSDFKLSDLRRRRTTIYLGIAPRDMDTGSVLMTLFVSQVLYQNLDSLPDKDKTLRFQLLLLLDEIRVLGKMSVLVDAAGYLAGYGIRLLTILQSVGQLGIYTDKTARAFMTNHGCKVVFAPREESDAKEISEALGTFTEMSESYSRNSRGGRFLEQQTSMSSGVSVSAQRRALMLPQEVKDLPFNDELAFVEGMKPIRANKVLYFEDKLLKERLYPPISIPPLEIDEQWLQVATAPPSAPLKPASAVVAPPAAMEQPAPAAIAANGAAAPHVGTEGQVDPSLLDAHLNSLTMECVNPEDPTNDEVNAYVAKFMGKLEELGAWK